MHLHHLLKNVQTVAIICNQWGDTGKGKFSDLLAGQWADVIARGTGGSNAGHTVVRGGRERIFQSLPVGIPYDRLGKINIIGNGMVLDVDVLCQELSFLEQEGLSYERLMISRDAHVIMPYHIAWDRAVDQSQMNGGIGSTGKGIGPCYADKIARRGIRIADLYDRDLLARKVQKALSFYPDLDLNKDQIIARLLPQAQRIHPLVQDTVAEMHRLLGQGKKILLEGAQGLLLSIEHGTYPYVTSSDCSLNGTATGVGLSARAIDLPLGLIKFPFMTRVGGGPFPTELGAARSEEHCRDPRVTKRVELERFGIPHQLVDGRITYHREDTKIRRLMNSSDPFEQGVGIRLAAGEYGAVTGRPRRVGWTDAVAARYAIALNGTRKIILTKPDAAAGLEQFRICYAYEKDGDLLTHFQRDTELLMDVRPRYTEYQGYGDISSVRRYEDLSPSLRKAISDFEDFTSSTVAIVSVGPEAEQTIVR